MKRTVETCLKLDTKQFAPRLTEMVDGWNELEYGMISWPSMSIGYVIEVYDQRRVWLHHDGEFYAVKMVYSVPNFGGKRWWFLCPDCERRVAKLYKPRNGRFKCRHCHRLTYESTRQDEYSRVFSRLVATVKKIEKLGATVDCLPIEGFPFKPKGMHYETYSELYSEWWTHRELLTRMMRVFLSLRDAGADADFNREHAKWLREEMERERVRAEKANAKHGTLGEVAKRGGVSYQFAQEAQTYGLIRADKGRSQRKKRYRFKLASWLEKLQILNQAGHSWEDLKAWSKRRFQAGHEHEIKWPEGFKEVEAVRS